MRVIRKTLSEVVYRGDRRPSPCRLGSRCRSTRADRTLTFAIYRPRPSHRRGRCHNLVSILAAPGNSPSPDAPHLPSCRMPLTAARRSVSSGSPHSSASNLIGDLAIGIGDPIGDRCDRDDQRSDLRSGDLRLLIADHPSAITRSPWSFLSSRYETLAHLLASPTGDAGDRRVDGCRADSLAPLRPHTGVRWVASARGRAVPDECRRRVATGVAAHYSSADRAPRALAIGRRRAAHHQCLPVVSVSRSTRRG